MSRGGARQKENRRSRRAEMKRKLNCSVEHCDRRGVVKVDLENGETVIFCQIHHVAALMRSFYKTNEKTEFV